MKSRFGLSALVALAMSLPIGLHAAEAPSPNSREPASSWSTTGAVRRSRKCMLPGMAIFLKATGIDVTFTSIPDVAKLKIMSQVGNVEWDVVDFEGATDAAGHEGRPAGNRSITT